jgi:flagellar hook-associated protein 1 FlgK
MSTIFGALSVAARSLIAQESAISTVTNNIANVNTAGYSREIPTLTEESPLEVGDISIGNGVSFEGARSVRDNILELRIDQETRQQYRYESYANAMDQVQSLFSDTSGSGLGTSIDDFFSSWQTLSGNPTDSSTRRAVISAGENLASAFSSVAQQLNALQQGLDRKAGETVDEINSYAAQLARLNQQIMSLENNSQEASSLEDQRYTVLHSLSQLVDVAVTNSNDGALTVTTTNGVPLVAGQESFDLTMATDSITGFQHIDSQGSDVTSDFTGGQLAGLLEARDRTIPSVQSGIDDLAASIINAVNTQSQKGYDANGTAGGNFFDAVVQASPGSNAGAAANMAMAISDPLKIAASSDGSEGNSANALAIANLQDEALLKGDTATEFYSSLVSNVGNEVANATDEQEAVSLVLKQLEDQRSNISGVSLDEEAANLIVYQRAHEAAAEMVAAIDKLMNNDIQAM